MEFKKRTRISIFSEFYLYLREISVHDEENNIYLYVAFQRFNFGSRVKCCGNGKHPTGEPLQ